MFYTSQRDKLRQVYVDVWQKVKHNQPLDAIEQSIAKVIEDHPEYQSILNNKHHLGNEYLPEMGETNPFLHMGMHLGLQEQIALDRPTGIKHIYYKLNIKFNSIDKTEHVMMECLAESLWLSQKYETEPDEKKYLECLNKLCIR